MSSEYRERSVREVMANDWLRTEDRLWYLLAVSEKMSSGGRGLNIGGYRDLLQTLEANPANQDYGRRGCEVLSRVRRLGWEIEQRFRASPGTAEHRINHAGFTQMAMPVFEGLRLTGLHADSTFVEVTIRRYEGKPPRERVLAGVLYQF